MKITQSNYLKKIENFIDLDVEVATVACRVTGGAVENATPTQRQNWIDDCSHEFVMRIHDEPQSEIERVIEMFLIEKVIEDSKWLNRTMQTIKAIAPVTNHGPDLRNTLYNIIDNMIIEWINQIGA